MIFVEFWSAFGMLAILFVNVVVNIRSTFYAKARIPKIEAIIGCDYVDGRRRSGNGVYISDTN